MNPLDYAVLFGAILLIVLYGILRTRGRRNLHDYLRGQKRSSWFVIGLSVMATQASAVTFLSTPGQGYSGGLSFVQNYFAVPLALVIIAAFFLPIFRRFNVYTAYEYLGTRFDKKTRLLAAGLFLFQRALFAAITIYAPAIVLSTVFGWNLQLTIIASGIVVLVYTVVGGSDAVTHTQKYQLAVIFIGMITAFIILLQKIPCSFTDALALAGHFNKLNAVSFNPNLKEKYTVWTGMLAGIFLMLSYFGTDQSQVQRYISGDNLRESRLGLMFNALFKIPMQFVILLLGVMLFVFYQFHPAPLFFNKSIPYAQSDSYKESWVQMSDSKGYWAFVGPQDPGMHEYVPLEMQLRTNRQDRDSVLSEWLSARHDNAGAREAAALSKLVRIQAKDQAIVDHVKSALESQDPHLKANDNDYVFITFILDNLPHGLIGLLVVCFFFATLQAKAAELNALASCTTIDFYRYLIHPPTPPSSNAGILPASPSPSGIPSSNAAPPSRSPPFSTARAEPPLPTNHAADPQPPLPTTPIKNQKSKIENPQDRHYIRVSKAFTIFWGLTAIAIALFFHLAENLIETSNTIGSLFSGVILGVFLIAFFIKFIRGTAAFYAALLAQTLVFAMYFTLPIAYLWYNLIGCLATITFAVILQLLLGPPTEPRGFPVTTD